MFRSCQSRSVSTTSRCHRKVPRPSASVPRRSVVPCRRQRLPRMTRLNAELSCRGRELSHQGQTKRMKMRLHTHQRHRHHSPLGWLRGSPAIRGQLPAHHPLDHARAGSGGAAAGAGAVVGGWEVDLLLVGGAGNGLAGAAAAVPGARRGGGEAGARDDRADGQRGSAHRARSALGGPEVAGRGVERRHLSRGTAHREGAAVDGDAGAGERSQVRCGWRPRLLRARRERVLDRSRGRHRASTDRHPYRA